MGLFGKKREKQQVSKTTKWASRFWKLGIFVVLLVMLAMFVPLPTDFIVSKAKAAVKDKTGRDLDISGSISANGFPIVTVQAEGVTLSNPEWATNKELVAIQRVAATINLADFLDKKINITNVSLDGLVASLEKNAAGKASWEFKSAATSQKSTAGQGAASQESGEAAGYDILLGGIEANASKLNYIDKSSGTNLKADISELDIGIKGSLKDPTINGNVTLENIALQQGSGGKKNADTPSKTTHAVSHTKAGGNVDFSFLNALPTVDFDILVKRFDWAGKVYQDVKATLVTDKGQVGVKDLSLPFAEGLINANAELKVPGKTPQVRAQGTFNGSTVEKLLTAFGKTGTGFTGGNLNTTFDITSTGSTPQSLQANASGSIKVDVGDGRYENDFLSFLGSNSINSLVPGLVKEDARAKTADVACIITDIQLKNGVATPKPLLMDSTLAHVTGAGSANLSSQRVNMELTLTPKNNKAFDNPITVDVGGTFTSPNINARLESVVENLVQDKFGDDISKFESKIDKKLGAGIGGALIGGLLGKKAEPTPQTAAPQQQQAAAPAEPKALLTCDEARVAAGL